MADDKKSGNLKTYPYGDLNPVFNKEIDKNLDVSNRDPIAVALKLARKANAKDSRDGTGPYRGIVLRVETPAADPASSPVMSAIGRYFKSKGFEFAAKAAQQFTGEFIKYKIYVPELDVGIPKPNSFLSKDAENDEEHRKIDRYHTFIAKDTAVTRAVEGELVWVDFGNIINFEEPTYLGPCFDVPASMGGRPAMGGASGSFNSCELSLQATTPHGVPLSENSKRLKADKNTGKELKKHIAEYRKKFGISNTRKYRTSFGTETPSDCRPNAPGSVPYYCLYHLRQFNDGSPNDTITGAPAKNPGNVQGLANSNYMSTNVHPSGGAHYEGYAIDIPAWIHTTAKHKNEGTIPDAMCKFWEDRGYAVIWRAKDHFHHLHIGWRPGQSKGYGQRPQEEKTDEGQTASGATKPDVKKCD